MEFFYRDIVKILQMNHAISISLRQVKRYLKEMNLARRKDYSNIRSVFNFVHTQVTSYGPAHGYRWMYQKCKRHGFKIKRDHISLMLNTIDPEGVYLRARRRLKRREYFSRGPNFCWHLDSYDKLKRYGLCINACIDGFSRKIIWLKVGRSSSNPKVIARYFIDAIKEHRGHPYSMRGDMGTENGLVAVMQTLFAGDEVTIPFIYGKSTMNTRIESWWGILRKKCCQVWISAMKGLQERGQFSGDKLDINLIQFCCMQLLQSELDDTAQVWNTHYIRRSREYVFHGRPVNMYLYPDLFNAEEHIRQVDDDVLHFCRSECAEEDEYPCEEEIFELGCIYMEENLLKPPENVDESVALYLSLRRWFIQQL
ncbi:uncharacterized protein [Mytilus edulis]|uniref:uncharacterized protein n=1 Tax=Mytilus edulis TaxID=6550 RepID=UPI0039EE516E